MCACIRACVRACVRVCFHIIPYVNCFGSTVFYVCIEYCVYVNMYHVSTKGLLLLFNRATLGGRCQNYSIATHCNSALYRDPETAAA